MDSPIYQEQWRRLVAKTTQFEFGIYDLLNQPSLVIEHHMPQNSKGKYRIMNAEGEIVAWLIDCSSVTNKIMKNHPRKFHIVNKYGDLILIIKQSYSWKSPSISVSIPGQNELGMPCYKLIGKCQLLGHIANRNYSLSALDFYDDTFYKFGDMFTFPSATDFPLKLTNSDVVSGSVDISWSGLNKANFGKFPIYNARFDLLANKLTREMYPNIGRSLTFNQRAVLLASAISIDFDYLARIEVVKKNHSKI